MVDVRAKLGLARLVAAVVAGIGLTIGAAAAQGYPNKPVRIIVPLAAGGPTDATARRVGAALQEKWGQPVIIENKTGAGAQIGTDYVAKAAPDGYTLLMGTPFLVIGESIVKDLPYERKRDFVPVALVESGTLVIVTTPGLAAKTVPEFIAYAKANPGKLSYASVGNGTISQMTMELFKATAGLDILNVPYRGTGPAMLAVMSGEVQATVDALTTAGAQVEAGKVHGLAVTASTRSPLFPTMPTVAETLPGFNALFWAGLLAPAGTPKDIVAKVNADVRAVLATPAMKEQFAKVGTDTSDMTTEQFARFLDDQAALFAVAAKAAGLMQ